MSVRGEPAHRVCGDADPAVLRTRLHGNTDDHEFGWVGRADLRSSDPSTGALGDYLSKVARETTSSYAKEGRDGSFSMFGLLREVIASHEYAAFGAWEELERTVCGKRVRFLTW